MKLKATGRPCELAGKLGISERRLYEYSNKVKELGASTAFGYFHNSYIYYKDGELVKSFLCDQTGKEELQEI